MSAILTDLERDKAAHIVALFSVLVHAWVTRDFSEAELVTEELESFGVIVKRRRGSKTCGWSHDVPKVKGEVSDV